MPLCLHFQRFAGKAIVSSFGFNHSLTSCHRFVFIEAYDEASVRSLAVGVRNLYALKANGIRLVPKPQVPQLTQIKTEVRRRSV